MFDKYLNDYYKSKIGVREICKKENRESTTFRRYLKKNGLLCRSGWYSKINTTIKELDKTLKTRYCSIVNRCNGKSTDYYGRYAGKEYLTICEWVEFCNDHKDILVRMWNQYVDKNRLNKYAISIDRLDNNNGYTVGNIQFATHGFNSWKRVVNPIKVIHGNETRYFMTCEDASSFYRLRKQVIGECLNDTKYHKKGFVVEHTDMENILRASNVSKLEEYYQMLLDDKNKTWGISSRKRV